MLILMVCLFGCVSALNVSLLSPVDGYVFNSSVSSFNITFEYNVSGNFNVSYCNLSVDGSVVASVNDSVLGNNSVSYLFEANRSTHDSNESYNWSVVCEDLNGAVNSSGVRSFKVNLRNTSAVEEFLIVEDIGNYSFVDFDRGDGFEIGYSIFLQNWTNGSNHFAYYDKSGVNYSMISFKQKLDDDNKSLKEAMISSELIRGVNKIRKNAIGGLFWSSGSYAVFLDSALETPWSVVDDYLVKFPSDDVVAPPVAPPVAPAAGGGSSLVVIEEASGWGDPHLNTGTRNLHL